MYYYYCKHCRAPLREGAMFCMKCGKPVYSADYYLKMLKRAKGSLNRKTDIDSVNHIMKMVDILRDDESHECFIHYLPMLIQVLQKYEKLAPVFNSNSHLKYKLRKIENTLTEVLDATEKAFEIRYNEICEEQLDSIDADISALGQRITTDGFTDSDFELSDCE